MTKGKKKITQRGTSCIATFTGHYYSAQTEEDGMGETYSMHEEDTKSYSFWTLSLVRSF